MQSNNLNNRKSTYIKPMIFLEEILEEGHLLEVTQVDSQGVGGNVDSDGNVEGRGAKQSFFYTPYKVDFDSE